MKRLRVPRWNSQFLPARSPAGVYSSKSFQQSHNFRSQSTQAVASSPAPDLPEDSHFSSPPPSSMHSISSFKLETLPSPLVSSSLSSAKLAALHARLSLPSRLPLQTLARSLVDRTADSDTRFNNTLLATLGADVLANYTGEHLVCHYPRLPMDVLFAAVAAYVGPKALAAITREWGVDAAAEPGGEVDPGYLQYKRAPPGVDPHAADPLGTGRPNEGLGWRRSVSSKIVYDDEFGRLKNGLDGTVPLPDAETFENASASFVRAVVGALYLHAGKSSAKRFYASHFLSRTLNLASIFDFNQPTIDLSRLCLREGFEPPVACLISETGRLSRHPVFVVGVYSGRDKLGEGHGSSLDEARIRAAAAALKGWYLYSPMDVTVPSDAETIGTAATQKKFKPNMIDCGEIIT